MNEPLDPEVPFAELIETEPPSESPLIPLDITTRPPAPSAPNPDTALILPPAPLVAVPDTRAIVPLRPTSLVPVRIVRPALLPVEPLSAVEILNEPLEDVDTPEDTDTEPPTLSPLSPDETTIRPPSPSLPLPITTLIVPATPLFELEPVDIAIEPLLPEELVPVRRVNKPLAPDVPALAELIVNAPLVVDDPVPLTNDTEPPRTLLCPAFRTRRPPVV